MNSNTTAEPIRPMRVVTDDLDRKVTIPTNVTRVVSLAPNLTESIFAVGAGDRLVGVTTFCNYPEQAKQIGKIGDTMNPNMESIVALKPDIVFVSTASQIENFTKTLEANGIAVYVTNPTDLAQVFKSIRTLGDILGTGDTASLVADALEQRVAAINVALRDLPQSGPMQLDDGRVRVFVQISREPLFTIGSGSFLNQLVAAAGGISTTAEIPSAYPKISKETAVALRPGAIILSDSPDNKEPNDAFKNSYAVKEGRVYTVNADLLSRPGPRLVDAMEQVARYLHPEKFK
ncbi:MAG: cobalamin-binding protein [Pyrinomonadaceae bacterium]|nr:cobalamin-binding protein [Acidobacteriota bacterium]MBP7376529.1 cobalamin-binding protein [Pyrinomonadaceae bacterium]